MKDFAARLTNFFFFFCGRLCGEGAVYRSPEAAEGMKLRWGGGATMPWLGWILTMKSWAGAETCSADRFSRTAVVAE